MLLNRLVVRNFGTLRGEQVIDLAPRTKRGSKRGVVLIGGQNGAGKTTVLEAVRLCLYGRLALGQRVANSEYQRYLRDRVHRNRDALINVNEAAVRLEFEHGRGGRVHSYVVERSWEAQESKVIEVLHVQSDGEDLEDVDASHWESFVRALVPPGLSQLFFFDGEKIQRLAEENDDAPLLAESIKALLGLDLVEQLQADLTLFRNKHLLQASKGRSGAKVKETNKKLASLKTEEETLHTEAGVLASELAELEAEHTDAQRRFSEQGGDLALERDQLVQHKGQTEALIEHNAKQLRELMDSSVVFAACPKMASLVIEQLDAEMEHATSAVSKENVRIALEVLRSRLTKPATAKRIGLDGQGKARLVVEIDRAEAEYLKKLEGSHCDASLLHQLTRRDAMKVKGALAEALGPLRKRARTLGLDAANLEAEVSHVAKRLKQAPEIEGLQALIDRLNDIAERRGQLLERERRLAERRNSVGVQKNRLEKELESVFKATEDADKEKDKLELAARAKDALQDYLERLTEKKVRDVERVAHRLFQRLARKEHLIRGVNIDAKTFRVTLFDRDGKELPKNDLSAGEKQIYAISILWALARVSGRALPMIIDTPLGRLDGEHRQNLVSDYFPMASHQVVILSTDTEIDEKHFQTLKPHLSHSLSLLHNDTEGFTEVKAGYFWNHKAAGHAEPRV